MFGATIEGATQASVHGNFRNKRHQYLIGFFYFINLRDSGLSSFHFICVVIYRVFASEHVCRHLKLTNLSQRVVSTHTPDRDSI